MSSTNTRLFNVIFFLTFLIQSVVSQQTNQDVFKYQNVMVLKRNTSFGQIQMPLNYALSFKITPTTIIGGWGNILHVTKDNKNCCEPGQRMPGIWVFPNKTQLNIVIGSANSGQGNYNVNPETEIPLNATTDFRLVVVNDIVQVSFNKTTFHYIIPANRVTGNATMYLGDPWHEAARVSISAVRITPATESNIVTANINGNVTLKATQYVGKIQVPQNYSVSFDIKPTSIAETWGSVLFVTNNMTAPNIPQFPAITIEPKTNSLYITLTNSKFNNTGINTDITLPPNQVTKFKMVVVGELAQISFNGTITRDFIVPSDRLYGMAHVFMSSFRNIAANATMFRFILKEATENDIAPRSTDIQRPLSKGYYVGRREIPLNYYLSFKITPRGTVSSFGSILHFTRDNKNCCEPGQRMPALWLRPNSTMLFIVVGSKSNGNASLLSDIELPINKTSQVKMIVVGETLQLTVNNISSIYSVPADRLTGSARYYIADPWYDPADATISNVQLGFANQSEIVQGDWKSERLLSRGYYLGKVEVPRNYSLNFKLKPIGIINLWSSIIHFTKDGENCCTPGRRMPALLFYPNSTRLHVRVGTKLNGNFGFDPNVSLTLNAVTDIQLRIVGLLGAITLNQTTYNFTLYDEPITGAASVFAAHKANVAAKATISNIVLAESNTFVNTGFLIPDSPNNLNVRVAVLIIAKPNLVGGSTSSKSVANILDGYGIPFNIFEVPEEGFKGSFGLELSNTTANYSAIVFPDGKLQYYNETTKDYPSVLTSAQWNEIDSFEKKYKTRRVMFDVYPGEKYGTINKAACCGEKEEQRFYFNQTNLARTNSQINPKATLSSLGLYHYNAQITNNSIATPIMYSERSSKGVDGGVIAVITNSTEGLESMIFHTSIGDFGITSALLNHVWATWITKDVYPGIRQVFLSTQIDDVFLPTGRWDTKLKISNDQNLFRLNNTDLDIHAEWTKKLNQRLPAGSNYRVELAFNGNGVLEHTKLPVTIYLEQTIEDDAPYDYLKPNGTGRSWWPANVSTNWPLVALKMDSLFNYFSKVTTAKNFYWLSHTFTHESLNNVSYTDVRNEIFYNQRFASLAPKEVLDTLFSKSSVVTPRITGLNSGDALKAMMDLGINNAVGDNTRPNLLNTVKPHWGLTTTPAKNGYSGFYIIPRYATEIYYHCSTVEENLDAYNYVYNKSLVGFTKDFNTVLDRESERVVRAMLMLKKDPHMFHQANLRVANLKPETLPNGQTGKFSLLMRWVEHITWKYTQLVNWPVLTSKQEDLFKLFKEREARDQCGYNLFVSFDKNTRSISKVDLRTDSDCTVPIATKNRFTSPPSGTVINKFGPNEPSIYWIKSLKGKSTQLSYYSSSNTRW